MARCDGAYAKSSHAQEHNDTGRKGWSTLAAPPVKSAVRHDDGIPETLKISQVEPRIVDAIEGSDYSMTVFRLS